MTFVDMTSKRSQQPQFELTVLYFALGMGPTEGKELARNYPVKVPIFCSLQQTKKQFPPPKNDKMILAIPLI